MSQALAESVASKDTVRVATPRRSSATMLAKRAVQGAFRLLGLPRLVCYLTARATLGRRAFLASSESIARIPGLRGVYARQSFYRQTLAACGQDVYFGWMSTFSMPEAEIGDRAYIGRYCSIGFAEIGEEVMLADHVIVLSGGKEHGAANDGASMHAQDQSYTRVRIGRGAWIGAGAIVMADVGEGAVVGAGAVVNRPIPDRSLAAGVPARVVRSLEKTPITKGDV
jgi:acetyltransferase-like isoleucine patch superfamily enzyme